MNKEALAKQAVKRARALVDGTYSTKGDKISSLSF